MIVEGGTSYVPETGRTLQTEAILPPGLPEGVGTARPVRATGGSVGSNRLREGWRSGGGP